MPLPDKVQQEMLSRLRRIEGQARGVQRMVEERRDCAEIVHQLAAIRAATHSASLFLLKHYAQECSTDAAAGDAAAKPLEDLIELVFRASP
jgi:DNA-binding FrmR family transcriptional regulator